MTLSAEQISNLPPAALAKYNQMLAAGNADDFVPYNVYKAKKTYARVPSTKYSRKSSGRRTGGRKSTAYVIEDNYKKAAHQAVAQQLSQQYVPDNIVSLVDQMIDPEASDGTIRWPNSYGKSAIYKTKNVINAAFAFDNRCAVAVHPRLRDAIFTTFGGETEGPLPAGSVDGVKPNAQQLLEIGINQEIQLTEPIYFSDHHVAVPFPSSTAERLLYPIGLLYPDASVQTALVFNFSFPGAILGELGVNIYGYNADGISVGMATSLIDSFSSATVEIFDDNGTPGIDIPTFSEQPTYLSIEFFANGVPYTGVVRMIIASGSSAPLTEWSYILQNHAQHMLKYDLKDADDLLNNAERAFVVSQSLLCTAEMSTINDGGVIAVARVPGGTEVGEGSSSREANTWYEWIASLNNNNYDGAVKHGCYSWYLPDDERGFFYRDISSFYNAQLPYIVAEFTAADTTESTIVRIKVTTVVQFTTNSNLYAKMPADYYASTRRLHYILSLIAASYNNDGHGSALRRHLATLTGKVKTMLKDPDTYHNAAKLISYIPTLLAAL